MGAATKRIAKFHHVSRSFVKVLAKVSGFQWVSHVSKGFIRFQVSFSKSFTIISASFMNRTSSFKKVSCVLQVLKFETFSFKNWNFDIEGSVAGIKN